MRLSKFGCSKLIASSENGPYQVARPNSPDAKILESCPDVFNHNGLWFERKNLVDVATQFNKYRGKCAIVVGSGPSFDKFNFKRLPADVPIFSCNRSTKIIEEMELPNPHYHCQVDDIKLEFTVPSILHPVATPQYDEGYYAPDFNYMSGTGPFAAYVAQEFGCDKIVFVGMDGIFSGQRGYHSRLANRRGAANYKSQLPKMARVLNCEYKVFTGTEDPSELISDRPPLSHMHRPEPSEPQGSQPSDECTEHPDPSLETELSHPADTFDHSDN